MRSEQKKIEYYVAAYNDQFKICSIGGPFDHITDEQTKNFEDHGFKIIPISKGTSKFHWEGYGCMP